ncbi:hypothetical protein HY635_03440 [Candidatus Uhrbacteria bacterium]|nr:hypothetical protein [Candidatus Uhrbacteria bacterium]
MDNRKISILFSVIDAYIQTAEPIASQAIVEARVVDASPATVRNEMQALEGAGYLAQPHTSSGRVPTEMAYRLYIAYLQQQHIALMDDVRDAVARVLAVEHEARVIAKAIARSLAASAAQAIVVGFARGDAYATGLAHLVVQPEFQNPDTLQEFSSAVDHLDETLETLDAMLNGSSRVVLGSENPFGSRCGTVATHLALPEGNTITLGIVGPMRMAYQRHLGMLETVRVAAHVHPEATK